MKMHMLICLFIFTSATCAVVGPSVTSSSTDFSLQNLVFLEFIWIFSGRNYFKINISHNSESKSYQINSIKSCSSRSFQQHTKGTFQFLRNFQLRFHLIFSEEIIQYSRTFAPQVQTSWNQPSPCTPSHRELSNDQKRYLKHPSSVDLISTNKTNKLPSFIDRCWSVGKRSDGEWGKGVR
jgi:hypothetical protein